MHFIMSDGKASPILVGFFCKITLDRSRILLDDLLFVIELALDHRKDGLRAFPTSLS